MHVQATITRVAPARKRSARAFLGWGLTLCGVVSAAGPGLCDAPAPVARRVTASAAAQERVTAPDDPELAPYPGAREAERLRAIRRALDWLATRQETRDGSVQVGDAAADQRAPLAVTSLAALAWISGGSTTTRGPHQSNIRRAVEYLLANTERATDTYPGFIHDRGDNLSRTHGHGLATLALAQAYTVSPGSPLGGRIRTSLVAAVERIAVSQGAEGGWYYDPVRTIQHEGSVTVALVQALRAANDVGIRVDADVVARAVDYVTRLQVLELGEADTSANPGQQKAAARRRLGGFQYALDDPKTSVALTAASLATLQAAGVYEGRKIDEGYDYIWRQLTIRAEEPGANAAPFPYYERFYLSQALWFHRETKHYRRWAEPLMEELIDTQASNGSWRDLRKDGGGRTVADRYGAAYATSCNVLFLALPDATLPLFHR